MGRAEQSSRAWPGACRSTDCDVNCSVGSRSLSRTPVAGGLCAVGGLCHSVKDQVLIYTSEWREAIVCKSLAQGN